MADLLRDAFEIGWAEELRKGPKITCASYLLTCFREMRALTDLLNSHPEHYIYRGCETTRERLVREREREAQNVVDAAKKLKSIRRQHMMRNAAAAAKRLAERKPLTDRQREALKEAQKEGKFLEPDSDGEDEVAKRGASEEE